MTASYIGQSIRKTGHGKEPTQSQLRESLNWYMERLFSEDLGGRRSQRRKIYENRIQEILSGNGRNGTATVIGEFRVAFQNYQLWKNAYLH